VTNKYGIPEEELEKIRARDVTCVYCHKAMDSSHIEVKRTNWTTIEHLNHLPPWNNPTTVAICCHECNSRRGKKTLMEWFKSPYCMERNINEKTIAEPVKEYIKKSKKID
jgi:hypothetical protein